MPEKEETVDSDATAIDKITQSKKFKPMAIITTIGAVGVAIVALNTFTGLNFRPAWGYEVERLTASNKMIQKRLDSVIQIRDTTSRAILDLNKGQYGLKLNQIDRQKRELRRELAQHQSRAQVFRDRNEVVPGWLRDSIADTETTIDELGNERSRVENQLLDLER